MALLSARTSALALALLALCASAGAGAEPVLIVHPSCPVSRLNGDEARKLLIGEDRSWSNGDIAQLVEVRGEDAAVSAGYLAIARKTPSQVRSEWNRLVFSGRANPPLRFNTAAEVRAAVSGLPGAFAVIDSSAVDASVKIVFRASGKG